MQLSYWEYNSFFKNIDFAIIGSGIVGLSTAIELKRKHPKKTILVVERGTLPYGASTKNAGFACFGSPSEILEDLKTMTKDEVLGLVEKRWKGLENLKNLVGEQQLEFYNCSSYELFTQHDSALFEECAQQIDFLNDFLKPIFKQPIYSQKDEKIAEFGFSKVQHLIENKFEGQINTGSMMKNLLKLARELDIEILNGIEVKELQQQQNNVTILCDGFEFIANKVIVCTNGFAKNLLPHLEVNPARAQVLITSEIPNLKVKGTFHIEKGYYYFRNINNRILLGGGRNLAFEEETTTQLEITPLIQSKLDNLLQELIIPNETYSVEMRWAGIMGVGSKKTTLVEQHSNNIYIAVRMGGMGVAIGSLIGKEVASIITH